MAASHCVVGHSTFRAKVSILIASAEQLRSTSPVDENSCFKQISLIKSIQNAERQDAAKPGLLTVTENIRKYP